MNSIQIAVFVGLWLLCGVASAMVERRYSSMPLLVWLIIIATGPLDILVRLLMVNL